MPFLERFKAFLTAYVIVSATFLRTGAFDISRSDNDDTIDVFPLAFLNVFFSTGGLPEINLSNTCNPTDFGVFAGTSLANCQFLAADIQACQAKGKIITLSLGGATGAASFTSDAQAQAFADTIWDLFLGGSSSTRPFGSAVLDGIDLDIEGGGTTYYASFVSRIRSHASGASKKYYVTAATTVGTGNCANVAAWVSNVAYVGGQQVTYKYEIDLSELQDGKLTLLHSGHLWTAQWWTYGDTPGGSVGVWTDNGACISKRAATIAVAGSASTAAQQAMTTPAKPIRARSSRFFNL
ncbi:hypothetical protein C0993_002843 [Termitomyces sp. T159_Od127]|nr:hypothetical protein C0993_002843 [Termitomyces sp. T159_Od127]